MSLPTCCEYYGLEDCCQGRDCPERVQRNISETERAVWTVVLAVMVVLFVVAVASVAAFYQP